MSRVRFHIAGAPSTEWEEEQIMSGLKGVPTAVARVTELRRLYPDAAISVEREGDSRKPNRIPMWRYKIKVKDDVHYSRPLVESEKDKALTEIREMFPKAEISEEQING